MYESLDSQFFRITTGIQSGLEAFEKSRLGVPKILCNFRLVLKGKTGKEILDSSRLEFLETFLANNFALSDAEDNISRQLNRQAIYSKFTFVENNISNAPKALRATFLGSYRLFCNEH